MRKKPIDKFIRHCPTCTEFIFYSRKDSFERAEKEQRLCYKCSMKLVVPWNKGLTKETNETIKCISTKLALLNHGKKQSLETITKRIKKTTGKIRSSESKLKIGNSNRGKIRTEETKKKLSIAAIKRIQRYKLFNKPNFNPHACVFIDILNYSLGFKFQHALNGGEVWIKGVYPDGYDKEKNIVFEYDEPWHKNEKFKIHDIWKEKHIIKNIHPQMFIRYDEKNKRLYDSITNIDISTNLPLIL